MTFVRKKELLIAFFRNFHPSMFTFGLTRPRNVFESSKEAMFSDVEPRSAQQRLVEWKARQTAHTVASDPDTEFYALLDNLSEQIAVCQGLRASKRFGNSAIQSRIITAEDRIQSALEVLYSIRPDENDFIKEVNSKFEREQV